MATRKSSYPTSRLGWLRYYINRFEKTLSEQAEHLACWYWLLHLEHEAE